MTQPGNDLERNLKEALRRKEPSADFTARVMARLPEERASFWSAWFGMPALRWAGAVAIVIILGSSGFFYREHQLELKRGREARQQVMLALKITGTKLQVAQQKIQQIGTERDSGSQQETEKQQ